MPDYQVWTKEEYSGVWSKVDCGDIGAVRRELEKALYAGKEPLLTVEVPFETSIKILEVGSETKKSKAKHDKVAGGESHGEAGRGDEGPAPELGPGSRDNSPGNSTGN